MADYVSARTRFKRSRARAFDQEFDATWERLVLWGGHADRMLGNQIPQAISFRSQELVRHYWVTNIEAGGLAAGPRAGKREEGKILVDDCLYALQLTIPDLDALVPSPVSATPRGLPVVAGRRQSLRQTQFKAYPIG
jgi:hypothetical protein